MIYLCGITQSGNAAALEEHLSPIHHFFDGLNWVYHLPEEKETLAVLEKYKGAGTIQKIPFFNRFGFARNHYLFNGIIKDGDWFVIQDSHERIDPAFAENLPNLIKLLEGNSIDGVTLHGKGFFFQFNEWMEYRGSVHEQLVGAKNVIELTTVRGYEDSSKYFTNRRADLRDSQHFVEKYLFYYLCPGSIHCLLGCEKDRGKFERRQVLRAEFREFCKKENIPLDVNSVIAYLGENTESMKKFINEEKIFNDVYRKYVLCEKLKDDHNWEDMIQL